MLGYIGKDNSVTYLMDGLKKLEARGGDYAGLCVLHEGQWTAVQSAGSVAELEKAVLLKEVQGACGIGYCSWARTDGPGAANERIFTDTSGELKILHSGLVENYRVLRDKLQSLGHRFETDRDGEVIVHLLEENLKHVRAANDESLLVKAVQKTSKALTGCFCFTVLWTHTEGLMVGSHNGRALWVGLGENGNFVSSEVSALLPHTDKVVALEEGEVALVQADRVSVLDKNGKEKKYKPTRIDWNKASLPRGGYEHFMLQEIYDQPQALENTLRAAQLEFGQILELDTWALRRVQEIHIIACGSAYHAGLVGKYYIEQLAGIAVSVDVSSEYKYRTVPHHPGTLAVAISQSGETADTISAVKKAKALGFRSLAICNVPGSTLTRVCDNTLPTHSGPEVSVGSTKAFTGQIAALYALAIALGSANGNISKTVFEKLQQDLLELPRLMSQAVTMEYEVRHFTRKIYKEERFLFLGKNVHFPLALEGAFKINQVARRNAEGFAAGEIKHGPIALMTKDTPVFMLMPQDDLFDKMVNVCKQCRAHGAVVVAFTTKGGAAAAQKVADKVIVVPQASEFLQPILHAVPLQFLAYWIAKRWGCDIDQPPDLTKSVTVE